MKVLIVEDETAALVNLTSLLAEVAPLAEVVATTESVTDTVKWFAGNPAPDLVFMDIHLADGEAFRIFEQCDIPSPIIFTTAYDKYALDAFRVNSIDYLLKPIKASDMSRALDKLARFTQSDKQIYADKISQIAKQQRSQQVYLIHVRDKIIPIKSEQIAFCYTLDEKVTITTLDAQTYPYDKSLDAIMGTLPGEKFYRANRQFIISREAVRDISVWFGSRLSLNLTVTTPERIIISKARVGEFKRWLQEK